MKKLLLATAIILGASTAISSVSGQHLEASAKSYDMSPTFAKDLKNGTMPRLKGKVGMTYKTLKKREKGHAFPSDLFNFYQTNNQDLYGFNVSKYESEHNPILKNQKVKIIIRHYNYQISESSVRKYFGSSYRGRDEAGRDVKANIYKAGKYYVYFLSGKGSTFICVGTKAAIQKESWIYGIYK